MTSFLNSVSSTKSAANLNLEDDTIAQIPGGTILDKKFGAYSPQCDSVIPSRHLNLNAMRNSNQSKSMSLGSSNDSEAWSLRRMHLKPTRLSLKRSFAEQPIDEAEPYRTPMKSSFRKSEQVFTFRGPIHSTIATSKGVNAF